jgi:GNAT superfamily N-acetyltransferase
LKLELEIRLVGPDDADAVARLSGELGYPTEPAVMRQRIQAICGAPDRALFVACRSGDVVAWIDMAIVHHVQAEARAEIGGLVVASGARGRGIGARLVARGEQWAVERGLGTVVVRSQIKREAAHRFYEREGYTRTKTSAVFSKAVS